MLSIIDGCRCQMNIMHQGAGRSDDIRQLNICDIVKPATLPNIGPASCSMYLIVLRGGKANSSGKPDYLAFIRHFDATLCAVSSLGTHLFHRFTLGKEPFPFPISKDDFRAWYVTNQSCSLGLFMT
jgi:hypothetical protein